MKQFPQILSAAVLLLCLNLIFNFEITNGNPLGENKIIIQEIGAPSIKNLEIYNGENELIPNSSDFEEDAEPVGIVEIGEKLRRHKRFILSAAAALGAQALRNQNLRWQRKVERMRLRNERYKLRNEVRLQKLQQQNDNNRKQLNQWNFNQQLNWQKHQQRWTQMNRQFYPMNYEQYMQMQEKIKSQNISPHVNFQQHPFPMKSTNPTTTTTLAPTTALWG